jgi:hypothetical protein
MRYFEIVEPPARRILADADPRETAPGEPVASGKRKPLKPNQPALVSNLPNLTSQQSRRPHLSPLRSL